MTRTSRFASAFLIVSSSSTTYLFFAEEQNIKNKGMYLHFGWFPQFHHRVCFFFFIFFLCFFFFSFSSFVDLRFGLEFLLLLLLLLLLSLSLSLSLVLIDDLVFLDTLALFKVSDDTLSFQRTSNK